MFKKSRIFSGCVCDQIVYPSDVGIVPKKERFSSDEERAEHRLGIARRRHARLVNANFTPSSLYVTLTFDDEHEVYDFADARKVRDRYVRRLRYRFPDAKMLVYMGRGKSTARIHLHMIIDGVDESHIRSAWHEGAVADCRHLREHNYDASGVDHGRDYTALANYLFNHHTEEQGKGKRFKRVGSLITPKPEPATDVAVRYSAQRPPRAPKGYKYVAFKMNRFGQMFFRYVLDDGLYSDRDMTGVSFGNYWQYW